MEYSSWSGHLLPSLYVYSGRACNRRSHRRDLSLGNLSRSTSHPCLWRRNQQPADCCARVCAKRVSRWARMRRLVSSRNHCATRRRISRSSQVLHSTTIGIHSPTPHNSRRRSARPGSPRLRGAHERPGCRTLAALLWIHLLQNLPRTSYLPLDWLPPPGPYDQVSGDVPKVDPGVEIVQVLQARKDPWEVPEAGRYALRCWHVLSGLLRWAAL